MIRWFSRARALLTSSAEGVCEYLDVDVHDPGAGRRPLRTGIAMIALRSVYPNA
jgi:hypothetical protein